MTEEKTRQKMTALAQTFPTIAKASGVEPWNAVELETWGSGPRSHGERVTTQLLLAVWDPSTEWKCGRFDLMDALRVWDPGITTLSCSGLLTLGGRNFDE
jgi:hypothetical protein